jgi:hypothetical protein
MQDQEQEPRHSTSRAVQGSHPASSDRAHAPPALRSIITGRWSNHHRTDEGDGDGEETEAGSEGSVSSDPYLHDSDEDEESVGTLSDSSEVEEIAGTATGEEEHDENPRPPALSEDEEIVGILSDSSEEEEFAGTATGEEEHDENPGPPAVDETLSEDEESVGTPPDSSEEEEFAGTATGEEELDESPPAVDETDVGLMNLYPVRDNMRDVKATITSDGDSLTVTGTDLSDVATSVTSSRDNAGSFVFHSAMSSSRMHTNTRFTISGTPNEFALRLYGKPCRTAILTKFRNLELFRVSNGSISFILSVYILNETIPKFPCFFDSWVDILCAAFNVARMNPLLCRSYRRLTNRKKGEYSEAVAAMLPFECLKGTKERKAEVKDTVTDMPHDTGLAFIRVFWDVIRAWTELPDELDVSEKEAQILKYDLDVMMNGTVRDALLLLNEIPKFARLLMEQSIFSARSVGIKSAWYKKPCSLVIMNDADQIRNVKVAHTALIHKQARSILTNVTSPRRELFIGLDVAHQIAPVENFTSFVCKGICMATFAKAATQLTKATVRAQQQDDTNSTTGKSSTAIPSLFLSFANVISHCSVSIHRSSRS